ncbi:VOC family protein [Sphingomonas sp.]|jgi:catechol-2,3-dioxygenase|uniref:VOC family protein n=1 Tax=Sphingomonas sp. TaxID=28214 RepID=UPI0035C867E0
MTTQTAPMAASSTLKISEIILKTPRYDAMQAWYRDILGIDPFFEQLPRDKAPAPGGGDAAKPGPSLLRVCFFRLSTEFPYTQTLGVFEDGALSPDAEGALPGLHHMQLMVADQSELARKYEAWRDLGKLPTRTADHGPITSFYYSDPDGNTVEITAENFSTFDEMTAFMASDTFKANPSGHPIDPEAFVAQWRVAAPAA